jgi:hypothetical protein
MARKHSRLTAGNWIAVPLGEEFAIGLLARVNKDGICVGYFFRGLYKVVPSVETLGELHADDAVLIQRFGGKYLESKRWTIIGRHHAWDAAPWPLPEFRHRDLVSGMWHIRKYSDDKALWITTDRIATESEAQNLPEDGCADPKWLEDRLARLLGVARGDRPNIPNHSITLEPPRHFMYFHDRELAENAARAIYDLGFDPSVVTSADDQNPWLLLAAHRTRVATDEEMELAGEQLQRISDEWGGDYDGWDKPG